MRCYTDTGALREGGTRFPDDCFYGTKLTTQALAEITEYSILTAVLLASSDAFNTEMYSLEVLIYISRT